MKLATRFILLFILAAIPVIALSSHFASKQFVASIQNEHHEIVTLLEQLEPDQEFEQAMNAEDMVYFQEMAKSVSDYTISIRVVSLSAAGGREDMSAGPDRQSDSTATIAGVDHRVIRTYFPIKSTIQADALEIASSLEQADKMWVKTWLAALQTIAALGLIGLAVFLLAGVRWIGKPLRMINEKMRRVGQGDFSSDLKIASKDEFGQLANEINRMCDQLQDQQQRIVRETEHRIHALEQLRHADRLVTVGRLAAGLAHEMGTPLNVVAGRASMILNEPEMEADKLRANALAIKNEAQRISSIVQKGLDYSRRGEVKLIDTDLLAVIGHTVDLLRPIAHRKNITINTRLPTRSAMAKADPDQIQQVLMNLVTNAVDAVGEGDSVNIELALSQDPRYWQLTIADAGQGIDPEIQDRVFEPFFTTKDAGFGTGLGLSIVKDIIEEHGGSIQFTSQPGEGTTFLITLPVSGS